MATPVGFIGLGRLGLPLAKRLLEAGIPVVVCSRGQSDEMVAAGAVVAGDGSIRAVAEAAPIILSCLPSESSLIEAVEGDDGILAVVGSAPLLVELSTVPLVTKERLRDLLVERGGDMLDSPVSGTPGMAEAGIAVAYASGSQERFEEAGPPLLAISPNMRYAGEFGAGTKFKLIAQVLATNHVTAAAEAMAMGKLAGLDLQRLATVISESPGATSGQFNVRGPMMAAGDYESRLVTIDMAVKDLGLIAEFAAEVGAATPLQGTVKAIFDEMVSAGDGGADPSKLVLLMLEKAGKGQG